MQYQSQLATANQTFNNDVSADGVTRVNAAAEDETDQFYEYGIGRVDGGCNDPVTWLCTVLPSAITAGEDVDVSSYTSAFNDATADEAVTRVGAVGDAQVALAGALGDAEVALAGALGDAEVAYATAIGTAQTTYSDNLDTADSDYASAAPIRPMPSRLPRRPPRPPMPTAWSSAGRCRRGPRSGQYRRPAGVRRR